MGAVTERVSQKLTGYRVKAARELRGFTQEQVAQGLGLKDRQSISDLENGKRKLKPTELMRLSDIFNQDIEYFIDPFIITGEAQFSWRADIQQESLDHFESKAGQWVGLLRWLRELQDNKASALKCALRLSSQSSFEDAQDRAEDLVKELNLGIVPAESLIEKINRELDIPVLFVDTIENEEAGSISGATCHLEEFAAILINRNEPEGRRFYNLAHELFHALTWDSMKPDHLDRESADSIKGKRIEQLANNFAASLLMPSSSLQKHINKNRLKQIEHLSEVATLFRVTPSALAWRLFNLKWISTDIRTDLCDEKQLTATSAPPMPFNEEFVVMLHEALENGRLSARKAAKALDLGLGSLKELFAKYNLPAPFAL